MQKKVSEIFSKPYGEENVCCEPSSDEIREAVRENNLEIRPFQAELPKLQAEWNQLQGQARYDAIRKYHAERVAFFVVKKWDNFPIILKTDGYEVKEGSHRLRAAKILRMETVEVEISGNA